MRSGASEPGSRLPSWTVYGRRRVQSGSCRSERRRALSSGEKGAEAGAEIVKTLWLLAKNVKDPDEPANLWGATLTGYNNFRR